MADASETPDWFGNIINNWISAWISFFFIAVWGFLGIWLALFGVNDAIAGAYIPALTDFFPPLAKEKWDATKEMKKTTAWYAK